MAEYPLAHEDFKAFFTLCILFLPFVTYYHAAEVVVAATYMLLGREGLEPCLVISDRGCKRAEAVAGWQQDRLWAAEAVGCRDQRLQGERFWGQKLCRGQVGIRVGTGARGARHRGGGTQHGTGSSGGDK